MTGNASLSDYLFELRRSAPPERLKFSAGLGATAAFTGLLLGPGFAALTGLGCGVAGICVWAWLNQEADAMSVRFHPEPSARARWLRAAGIVALGAAGLGGLLCFYSMAFRLVRVTTGM